MCVYVCVYIYRERGRCGLTRGVTVSYSTAQAISSLQSELVRANAALERQTTRAEEQRATAEGLNTNTYV